MENLSCALGRYWRGYSLKYSRPRYAVIAAMVMGNNGGAHPCGKVAMGGIHFAPVWPTFVPLHFIRSA